MEIILISNFGCGVGSEMGVGDAGRPAAPAVRSGVQVSQAADPGVQWPESGAIRLLEPVWVRPGAVGR